MSPHSYFAPFLLQRLTKRNKEVRSVSKATCFQVSAMESAGFPARHVTDEGHMFPALPGACGHMRFIHSAPRGGGAETEAVLCLNIKLGQVLQLVQSLRNNSVSLIYVGAVHHQQDGSDGYSCCAEVRL